MIAEIIDGVLGYGHLQYIEEAILLPLELDHTFGSIREVDGDDVMSGYWVGWEPDLKDIYHGSIF